MAETVMTLKNKVAKAKAEAAKFRAELKESMAAQQRQADLAGSALERLNDPGFNWSDFKANPEVILKDLFG